MIPFSILDLSLITDDGDAASAFRHSGDLVRHAEELGFARYWVAEHHAMPGIASAATSVLIGYLAGLTQRIRVGAGGVMLPNHAPLVIAEQFGTLATLYPGRIDLGLGRAPGSDQTVARALRRRPDNADTFPEDVLELLHYFEPAQPGQLVVATPGAGCDIPVWLLGSSLYSAQLAAVLGLPFAFASHFAPRMMEEAVALYRHQFKPSRYLSAPHVMLAMNVIAADTCEEAERLFTSHQMYFVALRSGRPRAYPAPVDPATLPWSPVERAQIEAALACRAVGDLGTVTQTIRAFVERHKPDELIMTAPIHDHQARRRSIEIVMEAHRLLAAQPGG
ncbi:LLM class flavin-dependent oxidoreductase [Acetobacter sp. TBRC 12305]|uniref:Luciferase-like monooxygenase n=1 Tax=Acetobacter garciniae TaxID=2817435 RepID=A0A939HRH7_9PROT|nr:LLM class flavin-dependent oxidoreductase [Acetobacter garciniae]MBO1326569.1 LLM class flavin-dependent oxidoreductase [Acetobacter garciniae]MBX0346248.1 LLM class flavin-dependent oxidoreductase [Acetobacter garciniae]